MDFDAEVATAREYAETVALEIGQEVLDHEQHTLSAGAIRFIARNLLEAMAQEADRAGAVERSRVLREARTRLR